MEYRTSKFETVALVCEACGEEGPTTGHYLREDGETGANFKAQTEACDLAKAAGWYVTGTRALCPDCDNAETNREDPYDPGGPTISEQLAEARRYK